MWWLGDQVGVETFLGVGGDVMEFGSGWAGQGWAREEGEAHLGFSQGAPLSGSGPGPDSLAAPAAGASSGSGSAAIYGAWMGRGGAAAPAPWAQTGWEGEEGRGRATAWEGATEPGEEGGLGVAQRQDPHRHSDTYLPLHATPTPTLSLTEIHTLWWCVPHTFTPENDGDTHPRLPGSHIF